jgi:hypothetical protein
VLRIRERFAIGKRVVLELASASQGGMLRTMKLDWITFWVAALACYRVTVLISRCFGPWGIFKKLRSIDRCSKLLKCPFCVSIYIGSFTAFALWLSGYEMPVAMWFILSFALSGITIALDRTFTADHQT